MKIIPLIAAIVAVLLFSFQSSKAQQIVPITLNEISEQVLQKFIDEHVKILAPLSKSAALASWNASVTGEQKYYKERSDYTILINQLYTKKEEFEVLKAFKENGAIKNPILLRQLNILYNDYLQGQIDTALMKKIVEKTTEIAERFNTFRGKIDGVEVSDNEIKNVLKTETDLSKRKKAWEASKQIGKAVAPMIIELAKLRNESARQIGFKNFYEMSLALRDQNIADINKIFDELAALAKRYGAEKAEAYPWYYEDPFFQEAPRVSDVNFDKYYTGKDIVEIAKNFYNSINLPVDDIIKNSDLYPKKGKNQHAFCTNIDNYSDVRVLCNITDNASWMGTILHELGHAVYGKNVGANVPYMLRGAAHSLTTEGIAMLIEAQSSNADCLESLIEISPIEKETIRSAITANLRTEKLVFCRWEQVMLRFEQGLYENPDQDLNKLWWDLVEKYQLVNKPLDRNEPDWAAKYHIAQSPAMYHNYMLGELFAAQLLNTIEKNVLKLDKYGQVSFFGKPEIGSFLKERVFEPGKTMKWDEFVKYCTGESLNPKYYVELYVNQK